LVRYRAGVSVQLLFTALFDVPIAASLQLAGGFSQTESLAFGYQGTTFGVLHQIAGSIAIELLTVTAGAAGVETITITLNGADFVLPATGGALSPTATAEFIADQLGYTGWDAFMPQANGATVYFLQDTPVVTAGVFTMSSTGAAAGTFGSVTEGMANVMSEASGAFVPQADWNVDTFDGSGPSGITLDHTKLNVFEIIMTYLGAGPIEYRIMSTDGTWWTAHIFKWPNTAITPSMKSPNLHVGWTIASLGSVAPLTMRGVSAAAFLEGEIVNIRDPFSKEAVLDATTTPTVMLALRCRGEFGGTFNSRELTPIHFVGGVETGNRLAYIRVVHNPTALAGVQDWTRVSAVSSVDYSVAPGVTRTGGTILATLLVGGSTSRDIDLAKYGIRCEAGDVLAVEVEMVSQTSSVTCSLAWHET
jgi:hypothetical protein